MTQVMTQPGLSLSVPTSRQDIISALLNDYGTSFGEADGYGLSPQPNIKELPPPPPIEQEKSRITAMNMRFQLRVDESVTHNGRQTDSAQSPTHIEYRSITRNSKPATLKLHVSNGTTAVVSSPAPPPPPAKDQTTTFQAAEERPLPPPPPEKSERRKSLRDSGVKMGHSESKLSRKSSRDGSSLVQEEQQIPKRKPVPFPKRFASLADLRNGPKGKPPQQPPAPGADHAPVRGSTPDSQRTVAQETISVQPLPRLHRSTSSKTSLSSQSTVKPKDPFTAERNAPAPPQPRRIYPGIPSNPRSSKQQQEGSPPQPRAQSKGSISSGAGIVKSLEHSEPIVDSAPVNTGFVAPPRTTSLAPRPDAMEKKDLPLPPRKQSLGDFRANDTVQLKDFPPPPAPELRMSNIDSKPRESTEPSAPLAVPEPNPAMTSKSTAPVSTFNLISKLRTDILTPTDSPTKPFLPPATTTNSASKAAPPPTPSPSTIPTANSSQRASSPPSQPPVPTEFRPQPRPAVQPTLSLPPIPHNPPPLTAAHTACYTSHATFAPFFARSPRAGCMVCRKTEPGRRVTCSWCCVILCLVCRDELAKVEGRRVDLLVRRIGGGKGRGMGEGVIREEGE
ncbi:hypothetical protein M011DRAFT_454623 [Sporormia fimetaria CBS 119925]|uniref:Uncharacterized protein n=1 Tax=Sporormia fimetaria CBS 119925 TaxID=1340428 RepID=A0A6A6VM46_9PLEO|nr:hypothetical protein M011DRAFT_454623 [Sporormia fimetaria CBS 119925]